MTTIRIGDYTTSLSCGSAMVEVKSYLKQQPHKNIISLLSKERTGTRRRGCKCFIEALAIEVDIFL